MTIMTTIPINTGDNNIFSGEAVERIEPTSPHCALESIYIRIDKNFDIVFASDLAKSILQLDDVCFSFISYLDPSLSHEYSELITQCFHAGGPYDLVFKLPSNELLGAKAYYDDSGSFDSLFIVLSSVSDEVTTLHEAARVSTLLPQVFDLFTTMVWSFYVEIDESITILNWNSALSNLCTRPQDNDLSGVFFGDENFRQFSSMVFNYLNNQKLRKPATITINGSEVNFELNKATCTYVFGSQHYRVQFSTIYDPNARNLYIESFENITDQIQTKQKLRDSIEIFRTIVKDFPYLCYAIPLEAGGIPVRGDKAVEELKKIGIDYVDFLTPTALTSLRIGYPYASTINKAVKLKDGTEKVYTFSFSVSKKQLGTGSYFYFITASDETSHVNETNILKEKKALLENENVEVVRKNQDNEALLMEQAKLALLGEMVESIAHQWRQPLNILSFKLSHLKLKLHDEQSELSGDDIDEFCDNSSEVIQMMSNTITDFQNFTKQDREVAKFTLHDAISGARFLLDPSVNFNNINLTITDDCGITFNGVKSELTHVFLNLIGNSRDAIIKKLKTNLFLPEISIICSDIGDSFKILVKDNGGGIPEEGLPTKIFEPRVTINKEHGTGIGLYMSKKIINSSFKGTIYARNEDDGAVFEIVIPKQTNGDSCD